MYCNLTDKSSGTLVTSSFKFILMLYLTVITAYITVHLNAKPLILQLNKLQILIAI